MPTQSPPGLLPWLFRDDVLVLDTRRLWLRWPTGRDAEALQAITSHQAVAEMTATWPHPLPSGEAGRRIEKARRSATEGSSLMLAIALRANPSRLIGIVGVVAKPAATLGLGYLLDPTVHGRGFMTEAVEGLARNLFLYSSFETIVASSRIDNPASRRVLEKVGFEHVGTAIISAQARTEKIEVDEFRLNRPAPRMTWHRARTQPDRHVPVP